MNRPTSPTAAPALRGVGPSLILNGNGFYVSYNDVDRDIYGGDTTALVLGQMERFFILNGDHRGQYASLIERGFDACLAYFRDHEDLVNFRSDLPPSCPDTAGEATPFL